MSLEGRSSIPEKKEAKEGQEGAQMTSIHVIDGEGKAGEPVKVEIVNMSMDKKTGRPVLEYKLAGGGGYDTTYTAQWKKYEDVEGWIAYPMD